MGGSDWSDKDGSQKGVRQGIHNPSHVTDTHRGDGGQYLMTDASNMCRLI